MSVTHSVSLSNSWLSTLSPHWHCEIEPTNQLRVMYCHLSFLQRSSMGVVCGPAGKRGKGGNKPEVMEKKTVDKVETETSVKFRRRKERKEHKSESDSFNINSFTLLYSALTWIIGLRGRTADFVARCRPVCVTHRKWSPSPSRQCWHWTPGGSQSPRKRSKHWRQPSRRTAQVRHNQSVASLDIYCQPVLFRRCVLRSDVGLVPLWWDGSRAWSSTGGKDRQKPSTHICLQNGENLHEVTWDVVHQSCAVFVCCLAAPSVSTRGPPRAPPLIPLTLQVIRPETCTPCGKRIRFGKIAMKCRNCRVVTHPECKQGVIISCSTGGATQQRHQVSRWKLTVLFPAAARSS